MTRSVGREVQRAIQSRAGLAGVAALVYLSGALDSEAEPAASEEDAPASQQAPSPAAEPAASAPQAEQKPSVPLPTVSVQAARPRPPVRPRPARPARASPPPAPPPPTTTTTTPPTTPAAGNVAVEGAGATPYQVANTGITRIPVPLIDIPQTVNIVPRQVIQEQRLTTMEDALRTVPGITFQAGEGGQQGDSPIIRGFVARTDMFRDGIAIRDGTRAICSRPTGSKSTRDLPPSPSGAERPAAASIWSPNCPPVSSSSRAR